jgi:glycosyltransferase involved in cell wall biosynthesis
MFPNKSHERAMKIVLVHNSYRQGGGEDVVFEQERENLERAGHEVIVYHRSNSEIDDLGALGRLSLVKNSVWSSDSRREFGALLASECPDVVHVHNTFVMISPSIYSACREFGVPVVQTLHNFRLMCPSATFFRNGRICEECVDNSLWSGIRHGCYRDSKAATATVALILASHRSLGTWRDSVRRYIALTDFAREKFIRAGFESAKIVVKPNFVDRDPGPRTGIGDYALYTGRLSPEKGLATLLDAWERLPFPCPLQVIGDGPDRAALEGRVRERNIPGITFRGRLPRADTIAATKGARFIVVPSICYEGFPMVIAEAFACGTPVLCSKLGGMKEIVADRGTGLHCVAGDADDLAEKTSWAWSHPVEVSEMGRSARREYEKQYTAERNYELLMEVYYQAAGWVHESVAVLAS